MPSLRHMEEIAWVLKTDKKTKKIGFVPMRDLDYAERIAYQFED